VIYTSHWRNRELADLDAVPVSISRGTPRGNPGYRFRRFDALAPDDRTWAHKQDREAFAAAYQRQMEELGARAILSRLEEIAAGKPTILLCWEKPTDSWCHRWQLADFIEREAGIVVPELEAGDLPRRPDSPQPSLFDGYREERRA
jgi:hypothetical protein